MGAPRLREIEKRVSAIEARNRRVELDKEWETSSARRISLLALTYLVAGVSFQMIGVERPFLNALVPSAAFAVSTMTLSLLKSRYSAGRR